MTSAEQSSAWWGARRSRRRARRTGPGRGRDRSPRARPGPPWLRVERWSCASVLVPRRQVQDAGREMRQTRPAPGQPHVHRDPFDGAHGRLGRGTWQVRSEIPVLPGPASAGRFEGAHPVQGHPRCAPTGEGESAGWGIRPDGQTVQGGCTRVFRGLLRAAPASTADCAAAGSRSRAGRILLFSALVARFRFRLGLFRRRCHRRDSPGQCSPGSRPGWPGSAL